jgi:copper chaperone NosL
MKNHLSLPARLIIAISSLAMICVLYLPIWRIELTAPQYPEGLVLQIYAHKIGGAVDIVNGLNHYIGMQTLHTQDFAEFSVLPYIIGGFLVAGLLVALFNRKWGFYAWYGFFLLIAVTSMIDFYRWEYNYGHHLDSNAPIKVPGMVYQPPLIGYKQLLNFTAYSIPDAGGWIFVSVGILLTAGLILEWKAFKKNKIHRKIQLNTSVAAIFLLAFTLTISGCGSTPAPIRYGQDHCDFCMMGMVDKSCGAEILTRKGKVFKFDDLHCLLGFLKSSEIENKEIGSVWFVDFTGDHLFTRLGETIFLKSDQLHTPMGGNLIAFRNRDSADKYQHQLNGKFVKWEELSK